MCEISIVLPTYNGATYIAEAIESVLEQTYKNFELIIVNDCSTDDTFKIINEYAKKDTRICIISNEMNMKLPQSLNKGFQLARGKYYTWTSDDNKYLPNALETMYKQLEENKDVGLVYCDMYLIDEKGNIKGENRYLEPENIVRGNCVGACFMYRRTVAESVGLYDADMFLAEDYDYWIRIYQKSSLKHINDICYLYRNHEKSLTAKRQQQIKEQTAKLWIKYFDFIFLKVKEIGGQKDFFDILYYFSGNKREVLEFLCSYDRTYRWYRFYLRFRSFKNQLFGKWKKEMGNE